MNNITLYGIPNTRSTRVAWALAEAGIDDYQFSVVDFKSGEQLGDAFRQLNPGCKIPVLVHDELVLTESAAIVNYVANQFCPELMPSSAAEKAHYDRWCYFVLSELEQGLWTIGKHKFALPEEHRVEGIFETASWEFQKALSLLSEGLGEKTFILGEQFSGADILIAHTLLWALAFKQPVEQENLTRYLARAIARPGYQRMLKAEGREE